MLRNAVAVLLTGVLSSCASAPAPSPERTSTNSVVTTTEPFFKGPSIQLPGVPFKAADAVLDVWMFDVGQGACVVIDCPDRDRPLLVDCGYTTPSVHRTKEQSVQQVKEKVGSLGSPSIVISHPDLDHYGLVADVVAAKDVGGVWFGGRRSGFSPTFETWLNAVKPANGGVNALATEFFGPDFAGLHCGSAKVDILAANAVNSPDPKKKNGDSVVLAVTYGDVTLILPGDAEGPTEALALSNRTKLPRLMKTQAVVVGSHHGAHTAGSNSKDWALTWRPIVTVFSMTPKAYRHPQCDVVERYAIYMPKISDTFSFACGATEMTQVEVSNRFLSTHVNGDMLFRISATRMVVYCQTTGPACANRLSADTIS